MKLKDVYSLEEKGVMTNLDSVFQSRDITLPTKVCLVKSMVFPVVMYGCESWTVKTAERWRIDAFELWCWRRLFVTPWIAACQASLSITNTRSSLKLICIESVMPSSHLILCCPLLLLPSIPPSIRIFSNESTFPKYWSFSFSISPSNEHPVLVSVKMDWLALPAVQRTLKSLLQHHSSKASILQRSAVFTVQLSHPYMTTGKTIDLTRQTFVGKVISLLWNTLSRLVITPFSSKE